MRLDPFKLERYLAQYEFSAPHQLSCSDCDGLSLSELLALAGDETRRLWDDLKLGYTESNGHPLLRAEIAGQYSAAGEDDVLVAGPQELIFLLMNCLVRNGDHVVCTYPAYQSLYQVAEGLHCEVSFWEADEKSGWRFDTEALTNLIRPSTRVLIVNFPHNPTGFLPSREEFETIVETARRHNLVLLCDEMYRGLEYDENQRLPAAVDLYERAVSLSGMSKVYGLAGLRVGWIASRDARLLKRVAGFKDYTSICSSAPSEILSLIGLRAKAQIVERHLARIRRNRGALADFIDTYQNLFAWTPPRAGTVCLPRVLPETLSADDLCREAVKEAGVVLVPSSVFDYGDRHVRFGLGREAFSEALAAFDRFLDAKLRGVPMQSATPQAPPAPPEPAATPAPPEAPAAVAPPTAPDSPPLGTEPFAVPPVVSEPVAVPEPLAPSPEQPSAQAPPLDISPVETGVAPDEPGDADVHEGTALDATPPEEAVGGGSWDDRLASAGAAPAAEVSLDPAPDQELPPWEDFPPSAKDAHPEASIPVPEPAAEITEPVTESTLGSAAEPTPDHPEDALPLEPALPEGIERGTGLLPEGFFDDEPSRSDGTEPSVMPAVVQPDSDVAEAGLAAAEPASPAAEPAAPVAEPAAAPAERPAPEPYKAPSEPAPPAPPSGSWETIEPPPGSSMTISVPLPPPDGQDS